MGQRGAKIALWIIGGTVLVIIGFLASCLVSANNEYAKNQKLVGQTFSAENSPYPARLSIKRAGSYDVIGDITVILPKSVSSPDIVRTNLYKQLDSDSCKFFVVYTLDGMRQTRTWRECVKVQGIPAYVSEIAVEIEK